MKVTVFGATGSTGGSESVAPVVHDTEAVICTLGPIPQVKEDRERRQIGVPVASVGTKNMLAAMPGGRGRLIVQSLVGVGESYARGSFGAGFLVKLALSKLWPIRSCRSRRSPKQLRLDDRLVEPV